MVWTCSISLRETWEHYFPMEFEATCVTPKCKTSSVHLKYYFHVIVGMHNSVCVRAQILAPIFVTCVPLPTHTFENLHTLTTTSKCTFYDVHRSSESLGFFFISIRRNIIQLTLCSMVLYLVLYNLSLSTMRRRNKFGSVQLQFQHFSTNIHLLALLFLFRFVTIFTICVRYYPLFIILWHRVWNKNENNVLLVWYVKILLWFETTMSPYPNARVSV